MMVELGQIEKPEAGAFRDKRKLYCIPNVYPFDNAPEEYKNLFDRYWSEVELQTLKLEAAGKVTKIFCENIASEGEKALETLERQNSPAFRIVKDKIGEGAILVPIERDDLLGPFLDWSNCLNVVRTQEAFTKIFGFFTEVSDKRLQHIMTTIEGNLATGEAGLLMMRDDDRRRLQFPTDIAIFLVTPPSYDDILRWFREKMKDFLSPESD